MEETITTSSVLEAYFSGHGRKSDSTNSSNNNGKSSSADSGGSGTCNSSDGSGSGGAVIVTGKCAGWKEGGSCWICQRWQSYVFAWPTLAEVEEGATQTRVAVASQQRRQFREPSQHANLVSSFDDWETTAMDVDGHGR